MDSPKKMDFTGIPVNWELVVKRLDERNKELARYVDKLKDENEILLKSEGDFYRALKNAQSRICSDVCGKNDHAPECEVASDLLKSYEEEHA